MQLDSLSLSMALALSLGWSGCAGGSLSSAQLSSAQRRGAGQRGVAGPPGGAGVLMNWVRVHTRPSAK